MLVTWVLALPSKRPWDPFSVVDIPAQGSRLAEGHHPWMHNGGMHNGGSTGPPGCHRWRCSSWEKTGQLSSATIQCHDLSAPNPFPLTLKYARNVNWIHDVTIGVLGHCVRVLLSKASHVLCSGVCRSACRKSFQLSVYPGRSEASSETQSEYGVLTT